MSSDASSHILHAARLLLGRAPTADAIDGVVEKWEILVVRLLDGLKAKRPEFLPLPEVISVADLLQDIADARRRVAWLEWGGDWLPGTMIEQCLSQLDVAANDSAPPPPPATQTPLHVVTTLPRVTAVPALVSMAAINLGPTEELDNPSDAAIKTAAAPVSPAAFDLKPEEQLDELPKLDATIMPSTLTNRAKRTAPDKASSCERPTKRVCFATPISPFKSIMGGLLKAQLDMHSLPEPRKVC
ncbi:hypothetical protein K503DRAFT_774069 [Rhizopogon vinicolor AM-OR11-026]|uniref:Uncharacterized protein n=1 Tax=Rhizopogon vinicolor AM-OR11-026 TaxID=1314800 RepID=A0A1B7MQK7_9AGAM|nr:hypothetical protein K503DRAFT_774069 [Rhizopogon vinicolor AM-OR11-026]